MNIQFRQHSREWLRAGNDNGGPSTAARVAQMIEMIALYRAGVMEESKFIGANEKPIIENTRNTMIEQFCKLTYEIMRATHWVSKTTGQHFKLTSTQKIIWVWMANRYKLFRSLGKQWFDDQEDIAKATGCDVSTVKGFIKRLSDHGYMLTERKKLRGFLHSNSYKIVAPLQLHSKHASVTAPVQSSGSGEVSGAALVVLESSGPEITPQEVVEQLATVFEDVPSEAYIDKPPKAPVIVHATLQGFADTLDAEIKFDVPVLPKGISLDSSESDLW